MLNLARLDDPTSLTPIQRTVSALVRQGLFRREIARTLGMTVNAVDEEIQAVYAALGISDLLSLAFYAHHHNLHRLPERRFHSLAAGQN